MSVPTGPVSRGFTNPGNTLTGTSPFRRCIAVHWHCCGRTKRNLIWCRGGSNGQAVSGHAPLLSSLVSPTEKAKVVFALSDDDITLTQSPYVMHLFFCATGQNDATADHGTTCRLTSVSSHRTRWTSKVLRTSWNNFEINLNLLWIAIRCFLNWSYHFVQSSH